MVLTAAVIGDNRILAAGETFEVILVITHDPMNADDVQILAMSVEFLEQYILAPSTASYLFNNGETGELGM